MVADYKGTNTLSEAAALPGGYLFVPAGLLLMAENAAEFAGVLAHSVAHVVARHETRQRSRVQIVQMVGIPLAVSSGSHAPQTFLQFARRYELEADLRAVPIMAGAGFDPNALARYIQRVQVDSPGSTRAFSPLPPRHKRVAALPARDYAAGGFCR